MRLIWDMSCGSRRNHNMSSKWSLSPFLTLHLLLITFGIILAMQFQQVSAAIHTAQEIALVPSSTGRNRADWQAAAETGMDQHRKIRSANAEEDEDGSESSRSASSARNMNEEGQREEQEEKGQPISAVSSDEVHQLSPAQTDGHFMKFMLSKLYPSTHQENNEPSSRAAASSYKNYLLRQQQQNFAPGSLSRWFYPTNGFLARPERADSNFIRFGRNFNVNLPNYLGNGGAGSFAGGERDSRSYSNNKKNNFIRLGRENPRQNNFIRLGRGGGGGGSSGFFDENENPRQSNFIRLGRGGGGGGSSGFFDENENPRQNNFIRLGKSDNNKRSQDEQGSDNSGGETGNGEIVLNKRSRVGGLNPGSSRIGFFPSYLHQSASPLFLPYYSYWGRHNSMMIPNRLYTEKSPAYDLH